MSESQIKGRESRETDKRALIYKYQAQNEEDLDVTANGSDRTLQNGAND